MLAPLSAVSERAWAALVVVVEEVLYTVLENCCTVGDAHGFEHEIANVAGNVAEDADVAGAHVAADAAADGYKERNYDSATAHIGVVEQAEEEVVVEQSSS